MSAVTIQQMADRVAELLTDRMHIKGRDLSDKLYRAGRRLPRRVREAGAALAEAQAQSYSPKLLMQIDEGAVARNYDLCLKFLMAYDRKELIKGTVLGITISILFSLLAVGALLLAVLKWQGYW